MDRLACVMVVIRKNVGPGEKSVALKEKARAK